MIEMCHEIINMKDENVSLTSFSLEVLTSFLTKMAVLWQHCIHCNIICLWHVGHVVPSYFEK